ncbi:MAG: hypothetical protein HY982_02995 [Candidatus Magasanikbacteria bacterium]|nr:hypothetical protein [Candidatus Magasanikbacteria bacterium]
MKGFTLLELMLGFSIILVIVAAAGLFSGNVLNLNNIFKGTLETREEAGQTLQAMVTEIRSLAPSNIGGYPIEAAASSSLVFFSDIDTDGLFERVRYFVDGNNLKKGTVKPTGSPLTYNPGNEIITEQIHNLILTASSTFSYYDANYTGIEPPLVFPVNTSLIRTIGVRIAAQKQNQGAPSSFTIQVTPRNLRSNL